MPDAPQDWDCLLRPEKVVELTPVAPDIALGGDGFCLHTALQLAQLSHLVYVRDVNQRRQLACDAGMVETAAFSKWELHWSRFEIDNETPDTPTVLCFRGSCDLRHWVLNVSALLADWPRGGKVHFGFQQAYRKLKQSLLNELTERPTTTLITTGHSLGAALAQLAASDLDIPCCCVYTFGSPRPGNGDFRDALEAQSRVHRVVHGHDFVTQLPQHWKQLNQLAFVHPGQPVRISSDGTFDQSADVPLPTPEQMLLQSLAAIKSTPSLSRPVPALLDHAPAHYVRVLRECLHTQEKQR
ncbi:MAG: lipase family protein [Verrucomicrobiae bacterium]|nr:lipase family protein [Verrucomicrobiae bacterium]